MGIAPHQSRRRNHRGARRAGRGRAWTCCRCCASTTCRCTFRRTSCTRPAPSGRAFSRTNWPGARIAAGTRSITIDPDDAKDFDDAICLQRISHEQWKLWVHIADVSHYVKPGTRAGRRGAPARQLDLPGGPRDPDAAGGVEQRTVLAETQRGSPDQVRGVSRVERGPGVEHEVLSGGDSFAAPLHLQGSAGDSAAEPPAIRSSRCCTTRTRWRRGSGGCASRPARSTWIFPK